MEKLHHLHKLVAEWQSCKACQKRDLMSLIGTLHHAAKIIRPKRSFVRRMIDLSTVGKKPQDYIRLNMAYGSDLEWWHHFANRWNGAYLMLPGYKSLHDGKVTSDASGSWGCGAFSWFPIQWDELSIHLNITVKELIPIVVEAAIWGPLWTGMSILAHCDNQGVVEILKRRSCKDQETMHLLKCLSFIEAKHAFRITSTHISGIHNDLADDLS